MDITERRNIAKHRIIVRDEVTRKSISFGIYNENFNTSDLLELLKSYIKTLENN